MPLTAAEQMELKALEGASAAPARGGGLSAAEQAELAALEKVTPPAPERPMGGLVSGIGEAAANMGSGMIAKPVSDVAGLASIPLAAAGLKVDPAAVKNKVQSAMTYEPRTTAGHMISEYNPLALIGKGVDWAANRLTGAIEPPAAAAGAGAEMQRGVARGAGEALRQAPGFLPAAVGPGKGRTVRPDAATLAKEGVRMTPGQIVGGGLQRAEDAATSVPIIGDAIKGAQRRGIESFDTAAFDRALKPLGEKLPKGMKGNEAVAHTYEKLGDAYDALLPKMRGTLDNGPPANALPRYAGQPAKPSLRQELDTLKQMGQSGLTPDHANRLNNIIDKQVIGEFTGPGLASGQTLKTISENLRLEADNFRRGGPFDRDLAAALDETGAAVRRMIDDVNPQHGPALKKVNEGYANFKRAQAAAGYSGAKEGVFTPAQLDRAVRAGDKSKDKARYAEGNALMQDLSGAGKRTLSQTVPDSGTPIRAAMMWAMRNPIKAAGLGIPITLSSAAYTPFGQAALQAYLLKAPTVRQALTSAAGRAASYGVGVEAQNQTAKDAAGVLP